MFIQTQPEALDQRQMLGRPDCETGVGDASRLVGEVRCAHHERVTLPMAARDSKPLAQTCGKR